MRKVENVKKIEKLRQAKKLRRSKTENVSKNNEKDRVTNLGLQVYKLPHPVHACVLIPHGVLFAKILRCFSIYIDEPTKVLPKRNTMQKTHV